MDTIKWARVMREAMAQIEGHLAANEESLSAAFDKSKGKVMIRLSLTITSESAYSADVDSSISYVVDKVKDGSSKRIIFGQEELPLPDETRAGKKRVGSGAFSAAQAKAAKK